MPHLSDKGRCPIVPKGRGRVARIVLSAPAEPRDGAAGAHDGAASGNAGGRFSG